MRFVKTQVPGFEELGLLDQVRKIAESSRGIVLVAGATGCGKSTTLAAMIEHINANFKKHVVTLEDPEPRSLAFNAAEQTATAGRHDHFDLITTRGVLRLTDPRRFGAVVWSAAIDAAPASTLLARLGFEPFDAALTPSVFHAALRRRRTAVKTALLAGDIVVGAGNIYACEALFVAGIDPRVHCDRLSRPRAERLLASVRATLARALELGGSSLRDFRDTHGIDGAYQLEAQVYGREGQPCQRCGGSVRRIVQAQRSTFFCPRCQKR
jgi:formamidopyrimidine-DNA glycosylase